MIRRMRKTFASRLGLSGRVFPCTLSRLAIMAIALGLSGCGDEVPVGEKGEVSSSSADATHKTKWLEISSRIGPAQWLASRGSEQAKPLHDPDVQRIGEVLASAHALYRESERMIANRSVQVSEMLGSLGIDESATDILHDLTAIAGEVGQTEGFGAISQHYFNLRAGGATRADALAKLKALYGTRS